jgi:hypothetical protein
MRLYFTIFSVLIIHIVIAQRIELSGILRERSGEPMIFTPILNRTTGGVYETDIDGRYTVPCMVGDVLVVSYIGYNDLVIIVTKDMIKARRLNSKPILKEKIVAPIKNRDFMRMMHKMKEEFHIVEDTSRIVYSLDNMKPIKRYNYQIVDFKDTGKAILLTRKKEVIYYGGKVLHKTGISFVQQNNLPALQTSYGPGYYVNGQLTGASNLSWGEPLKTKLKTSEIFRNSFFHETMLLFSANNGGQSISNIFDVALTNIEHKDQFNINKNYLRSIKLQSVPFKSKVFGVSYEYKTALISDNNIFGYYSNGIKKALVENPLNLSNLDDKFMSKFPFSIHDKNELLSSSHILTTKFNKNYRLNHLSNVTSASYESGNYNYSVAKNNISLQSRNINLVNKMEYQKEIDGFGYENFLVFRSNIDFSMNRFNILNKGIMESGFNQSVLARNYIGLKEKRERLGFAIGNNFVFSNWQNPIVLLPFIGLSYQNNNRQTLTTSVVFNRNVSDFNLRDVQASYLSINSSSYAYGLENTFTPFYLKEGIKNEIDNSIVVKADWQKSNKWSVGFSYNYLNRENAIHPVVNQDKFFLENVANFESHAFKILLGFTKWKGNNAPSYGLKLELMRYFGQVNKVTIEDNIVFLYGYQNVSKVWIENQPLGTIYGYDYKRNKNGVLIINEDGFPIKNDVRSIIGNSNPDLYLSLIPYLRFGKFQFDAIINFQIGGQIWDGTSLSLDYHGASASSAAQRKILDYIYPGLSIDDIQNSKLVQLDNQENSQLNRWMRYGEDGVSIDGIRNASHMMIKMLKLTYQPMIKNKAPMSISFFAENIFTIASYQGFANTPLLDINSNSGINYFNRPIQSNIGLSLTFKI